MCKKREGPQKADVKRRAAGRWDSILRRIMPQLADAIDAPGKQKVKCPVHGGTTDRNFRTLDDFIESGGVACNTCGVQPDGFQTLVWLGMSFSEAVTAVAMELDGTYAGMTPEQLARQEAEIAARRIMAAKKQAADDKVYRRRLNEVWTQSVPLDHPDALPARLYLQKRGLGGLKTYPSELRFHSRLAYATEEGKFLGHWPAIVARFRSADGMPASLQRLYVGQNGEKLALPDRKKLMSAPSSTVLTGGAIHLSAASTILGVAEGVETALAAHMLYGINVWATYSAQLMESFVPPPGVEKVLVFADKDRSERGEQAARKLVQRLWESGMMAGIRMPEGEIPSGAKGIDFLDLLEDSNPLIAAA